MATQVSHPSPRHEQLKTLVVEHTVGKIQLEFHSMTGLFETEPDEPLMCSHFQIRADDLDVAEQRIALVTQGIDLEGELEFHRCRPFTVADDDDPWKSIEIYFDISDITQGYDHNLDFRNEAMEIIEQAPTSAKAGEWEGAESGAGEVDFGFTVEGFDPAERIVRDTVKGTSFDFIREISRFNKATDLAR